MWARTSRLTLVPVSLESEAWSAPRDMAVIDVGSNSVRLVLYRVEGRAIWTVFNEKVLAGLGRDLAQTGHLSPDGVKAAFGALRRFRALLDAVQPAQVFATATAAVREARDRAAFLDQVEAETGFVLRVLSGEEEARYSALGVVAGAPGADGVVGDLGGSSLELIGLEDGVPGSGVTLPLGPLALGAPGPLDPRALGGVCEAIIDTVADRFKGKTTFHAVGGAWRNLAIVRMNRIGYPLQVVQGFEMSAADTVETAGLLALQSRGSLDRIAGVSRRRAETLPHAAVVLRALVERMGFQRIVVSAYGLREGLLFDSMPERLKALDPLVEGCAALAMRNGLAERLGPALETWLQPLLEKLDPVFPPEREKILAAAASRLADLGARLHPDHRADLVFQEVLRAPIPGQSHAERAFLAMTTFHRYGGERSPEQAIVDRILSAERLERAEVLGTAIRLGCQLSGRNPDLLQQSTLTRSKSDLVVSVRKDFADLLLGEQTLKRAESLARALGLELKVKVR
jgi:exopolyphosphatase/guanosine-5'-triphosphate,3'-diphosphate pyrophosphatase